MKQNLTNRNIPKSLSFTKDIQDRQNIDLLVHGQGVLLFKQENNKTPCIFYIYNQDKTDGLKIEFTLESVSITEISSKKILEHPLNNKGLTNNNGAYYWFSIDSQNQRLYTGIGEARLDTIIYKYLYKNNNKGEEFFEKDKQFLKSLVSIQIATESTSIIPMRLLRDPITQNVPLFVKDTNELTMTDIAEGSFLPDSNLSLTSQILYNSISGKKFVLNDNDFPDFSKAIEYSIATPGMWCNKKLKEKSTEFSKDTPNLLETYLRITLGENNGESPGIPYVMEIWPVNHYSPIHSHAEADAIIRVLHGEINVTLYPYLCAEKDGVKPFGVANFKEGDITWISPTLNQIHKLKNLETNTDTCITIQCYMYNKSNKTHYDYFDYIDDFGQMQQYEPDSDMNFIEFKELMKKEWNDRPN